MKWKITYLLLAAGFILSLIFPVRYYFADKQVPRLPSFTPYESAIDSLATMVQNKAAENNCRHYIVPVRRVRAEEDVSYPPNLREDINLALASYRRWSLVVDREQSAEMRERFQETMRIWGPLIPHDELDSRFSAQTDAALRTEYSANAVLSPITTGSGNDLQLILSVNRERTRSELFSMSITFANPETVLRWENQRERKIDMLATMHRRSRQGLFSAFILFCLAIILTATTLFTSYIARKKHQLLLDELNDEIQKRQELVDNGHFVAALELADRFLQFYPNDIEIKAFRERLLDYTNDNPKKAQVAYVEYMKIQARMSKPLDGSYLTDGEKQQITSLLPYHPKLAESFPKLISYEDEEKQRQELRSKLRKVRELLGEAKISAAELALKDLENNYPPTAESIALRNEIDEKLNTSKDELESLFGQFLDLDLMTVKNRLKLLIDSHQDFKEGKTLLKALENKKLKDGFQLVGNESNRVINVLTKEEVILGREEEGVHIDIAVNEKYVSRPHLKIVVESDKVLIEDLNSSGGTYVNGEKVGKHILKNGDLLILGKVVDVDFLIYKTDKDSIGGLIINLPDENYIIVKEKVSFDYKKDKLLLAAANSTLLFKEGQPIIVKNAELQVLRTDDEIDLGEESFKVRAKSG